jgi:hypothetical protein
MIDRIEPSFWGMALCNCAILMFALTMTLASGIDVMAYVR